MEISGSNTVYDLVGLDEKADMDKIFYKQRWINENGLEQNLVVTFSLKYRNYQQNIRNRQIERAQKVINTNPKKLKKYTCSEIINGLRNMNFYKIKGDGYMPTYTRNDFTNDLHDKFRFRMDYQIVTIKQMEKIFRDTKK